MKITYLILIAGLLLAAALVAGCTTQPAAPAALKIGVVASMTGPASTTGRDIWQSAQLAADEINANGGVFVKSLGKNVTIELVQGDDESTREGGIKAVTKMITDDKDRHPDRGILVRRGHGTPVARGREQGPVHHHRGLEPDDHATDRHRYEHDVPPLSDHGRLRGEDDTLRQRDHPAGDQREVRLFGRPPASPGCDLPGQPVRQGRPLRRERHDHEERSTDRDRRERGLQDG